MSTQKILTTLLKAVSEKTAMIDERYRESSVWMSNEFELISKLIKQNPRDTVFDETKEVQVEETCVIEEPAPVETKSAKRKSSEAAAFASNLSPELKRQSIDFELIASAAGLPSDLNKLKKDDLLRELAKRGKKANVKDNKPVHVAALKDALLEEYSAQQYAMKQQPFTEVPSSSAGAVPPAPAVVEPAIETNAGMFNTYPPASTPAIATSANATVGAVPTAPPADNIFYSPSKQRKGSLMSDFRKQVNMTAEPVAPVEAPDAKMELQRRRESQAARKSFVAKEPSSADEPMSPGGASVSSGGFEDAMEAPMAPLDLDELSAAPEGVAAEAEEQEEEEVMQVASPVRIPQAEIPCTPAAPSIVSAAAEPEEEEPVEIPTASAEEEAEGEIFSDVESVSGELDEATSAPAMEEDAEIVEVLAPSATAVSKVEQEEEDEGDHIALDYTSPVQRGSSIAGSIAADTLAPVQAAAPVPVCPVSPDDSVTSTTSAATAASTASAATATKAPEVLVKKPLNLMGAKPVKSTVAAIEQSKKAKELEDAKEAAKKQKLEQMRNAKNPTSSFTGSGSVKSTTSTNSAGSVTSAAAPSTASAASSTAAASNKMKTVPSKPVVSTAAPTLAAPVAIKPPASASSVVNTTASAPAVSAPMVKEAPVSVAPVASIPAPATTAAVPAPPAPAAATSTPKKGGVSSLFGAIFGGNKSPTPVAPASVVPATSAAAAPSVKKSSFDISVVETKSSVAPKPTTAASPDAPFSTKTAATAAAPPAAAPSSMMSPTKPDPFKNKAMVNSILQNFKEAQATTSAAPAPIVDLHKAVAAIKPQPAAPAVSSAHHIAPAPAPTPAASFASPAAKPAVAPVAAVSVPVNATPLKDITAKITGATPSGSAMPAVTPAKEQSTEYPIEDRETSDDESADKEGDDNSATEDEDAKKKEDEKIPEWAKGKVFIAALEAQFGAHGGVPVDPDTIFNPPTTCNLEQIFGVSKGKHRTYSVRSSSAHWDADSLTLVEKRTYRAHMGYDKQQNGTVAL